MTALEVICGLVILALSIALIAVVILQQGHDAGLGAIAGGADNMLGKQKDRSLDALMAKWTKIGSVAFFVIIIFTNACLFFMK